MNTLHEPFSVIFGLGQTGLSCVRYGYKIGMPFCVVDTRASPPNLSEFSNAYPNIDLFLGDDLKNDIKIDSILKQARQIIVSPGVDIAREPFLQEAKRRGIPLIGDIELFAQSCKLPYIAITGSNGKTTVTTLVGKLIESLGMRVGVGGNIGIPALDLLSEEKKFEVFVLELSSFQLETTYSLHPTVATILNITPDHLDRYACYDDYITAKQKILENAIMIVPPSALETPKVGRFGIVHHNHQDWFALNPSEGESIQLLCAVSDLQLVGAHNYLNVISALSLVHRLGVCLGLQWKSMIAPIITTLKTFQGLDHRCQPVHFNAGITWINDSKGTNIGASVSALKSIVQMIEPPGKMILIAGGDGKNQDFELLREGIDPLQGCMRQIILIGKDALQIQKALNQSIASVCMDTLAQAVHLANQIAQKGDFVLLSPSCSSLDQYSSYVARGEDFIATIKSLNKE